MVQRSIFKAQRLTSNSERIREQGSSALNADGAETSSTMTARENTLRSSASLRKEAGAATDS
jgi:hypothetical protein